MEPPGYVCEAFGGVGGAVRLGGGEGRSWLAGAVVLKPCDDPVEWAWLADVLPTVVQDGFRLALPVRAFDGRWEVDGWCAQLAVEGVHPPDGRWLQVLVVSAKLHAAIAQLWRPAFIDARVHPWSIGDRVAWAEAEPPYGSDLLDHLLSVRRHVELPSQVIHGDLSGNVLFAEDPATPPAVIDVTPYWRPAGLASAIVVADAMVWRGAEPGPLLGACGQVAEFPQLFVRALIYRLVTSILFGADDLSAYVPAVELALRLAG